jgi:hypothetical protein
MADGDHTAGLLRCSHLKFEPVADIVHRVSQPWLHMRTKMSGEAIGYFFENVTGIFSDVIRQNKTGTTFQLCRPD